MRIQKVEKGTFTASLWPVAKKVVQMFRSRQAVNILLITILQHKGTDKVTSSASEMNFQRIMVSLQNWKWLHNPPSYFHSTFEMPKWKTGDWLIFWSEDRAMGLSMGSNPGHFYSLRTVQYLDWTCGATASSWWWNCVNTHISRKATEPAAFQDDWWLALMPLFGCDAGS